MPASAPNRSRLWVFVSELLGLWRRRCCSDCVEVLVAQIFDAQRERGCRLTFEAIVTGSSRTPPWKKMSVAAELPSHHEASMSGIVQRSRLSPDSPRSALV